MNLSKEELLEANKRYPKGTRFKSASTPNNNRVYTVESGKFMHHIDYPDGGCIISIDGGCVKWMSQWAEILPKEKREGVTEQELHNVESILAENKRLNQELKEAKEYREKVEAVIDWREDMEEKVLTIIQNNYSLYNGTNEAELHSSEDIVFLFRDQFKQIK